VSPENARGPGENGPAIVNDAPGGGASSRRGHGTILVVDDDSGVREVMRALLEHRRVTPNSSPPIRHGQFRPA
jgi:hypothetical protein